MRLDDDLDLGNATTLVVDNAYGDIHVRAAGSHGPRASLFVQLQDDDAAAVRWALARDGHRLVARVVAEPGAAPLRADATLLVPPGVSLRLYTDDGAIDAKGLANDRLAARTGDGDIRIIASSLVHARTEGGRIRATFTAPGWAGTQRLETATGPIEAYLPLHDRLALDARTAGRITSEWRADIRTSGGNRQLAYRVGDGHDAVVITSGTGDIALYELIATQRR